MHELNSRECETDLVVVGGGLSGMATAITAARHGLQVALVQDRPVFGGTTSKEIRVAAKGAGGGANNVYYRETGLVEELTLENLRWNPHCQAERWSLILSDAVLSEPNITALLNTVVLEVEKDGDRLHAVKGYTLAAETWTRFTAPLFVDATGDGTVGALAGAASRMGREAKSELGEPLAPESEQSQVMGSTLYLAVRRLDHPVEFRRPAWAHCFSNEELERIPHRFTGDSVRVGFVEWGGELNTITDNEQVKYELWRIGYGVWDHFKNHPDHREEASHMELEWMSIIPGKRESRRLMGPYLMTENDIREQTAFPDAMAYGGWYIDDHHSDGFFHDGGRFINTHPPGVYGIPLRSLYSRDVPNLFFAGRDVSLSHMALCSARVILTCAQMGEAVGMAAAHCHSDRVTPSQLAPEQVTLIQQDLLKIDHWIPGLRNQDREDLALEAQVQASSEHMLGVGSPGRTPPEPLRDGLLVMFPLPAGQLESLELLLTTEEQTELQVQIWRGDDKHNFFPQHLVATHSITVEPRQTPAWTPLEVALSDATPGWYFAELRSPAAHLHRAEHKLVGVKPFVPRQRRFVKFWLKDDENPYSLWKPVRDGGAPCIRVHPDQGAYAAGQATNGYGRPYAGSPNLWISGATDFRSAETLTLSWPTAQHLGTVHLAFDTDLDRDLDALWKHHEHSVIDTCVRSYTVEVQTGSHGWTNVADVQDNYQRRRVHRFDPVEASRLRISVRATWGAPFASIYDVRAYADS